MALGNLDALSQIPDSEEWTILLAGAKKQGVVALMLSGLERLPSIQRPSQKVLLCWIGIGQMTAEVYSLQCARAKELTHFFNNLEFGVKSCVLKGVGMSQLYPVPARRHGGDIDIWVDGSRKEVMKWLHRQCDIGHVEWHHAEAKLFKDVSVEVHFHPGWLYNPAHNRRLQRWFNNQKNRQFDMNEKLGFAYPTVRFNAVYSLIHLYHHLIEEGVGIRHIVDYYFILKALPVDERSAVLADLKSFGMNKVTAAMMWVLQEVCGLSSEYLLCEPDEKEGRFVLDEVMNGGNFGQYRKDFHRRNTVSRFFFMLHHYPKEVLWVVPWKLWHMCWRLVNG